MAATLLEYLQLPNPQVTSYCRPGAVSVNRMWPDISGIERWDDFDYNTLLSCYGDILEAQMPKGTFPPILPKLTKLEREIWDEDSLRMFLGRSVLPQVTAALNVAFRELYPEAEDPPEIRPGGFANDTDSPFFPDWAAIRYTSIQDSGGYTNLLPGETKVAAKWMSSSKEGSWIEPWKQAQTYSGVVCRTRYGYILTDSELVVLRIRANKVDEGIAKHRGRRIGPMTSPQARRVSGMSQLSSISSTMSQMSISDYIDDEIEFAPIQFRAIPWERSNKMTIKLALFWLHMLASVPNTSKSIESGYPPLDSWEETGEGYSHVSTGHFSEKKPRRATILDGPTSSTEIDDTEPIYIEDVEIDRDKRNGWILKTRDGRRITTSDIPRLPSRANNKWYILKQTGIDSWEWRRERQR